LVVSILLICKLSAKRFLNLASPELIFTSFKIELFKVEDSIVAPLR